MDRQENAMRKSTPSSAAVAENGAAPTNGHGPDSSPHLRALLHGLQAVAAGDFSVRLPGDWIGLEGKIADTFNDIVTANHKMAAELHRVGQVVGKEGKTRQRTRLDRSAGAGGEMELAV